ncbi:BREX-1 system adenine-specific DNA-methyltransferase PglX [Amygdalobacter indicium]|uniref:BREX-1 system adenine-specific DNA-methyltransferase PglX n=1 Tax=Amygdalobacter indicium TaxID=3029272 RepID=UPI00279DDECE|nr:BREX-1 system adenine-specific DNA-methyltransferase PglX [Amygdalobacter indicium]WEG34879.1 BREX-1 system adenine-specific DNA-methyltransferase PglX [Amygdalobacter indicium]
MNKSSIKNFAIRARNKLIADIRYRAGLMGITADGIKNALPQSTGTTEFYDIGTAEPYSISGDAVKQRKKLVEVICQKEKDTDYQTAYEYIIEEVAYTWFNRLIAIRFMEVNDYLPSHMRVLSSDTGKLEPDIVTNPFYAELDFTGDEEQTIMQLKNDNQLDELFRMLFIKQCNALNEFLPALFEKTKDYTEVLLNLSVIDQEGVIYKLVHDIDEDDFNVEKGGQVEIIGWLYQYYNSEKKDDVFAALKKNIKITKENIPAATQLFTPDWIVRYMVENSLGRLWVEGHPNDELKSQWKYYLEEAEQELDVQLQLATIREEYKALKPEDILCIDPCSGSGHILAYMFDVLMQIYESYGYTTREAVASIVENNLYGLDIDDRAVQLSYFTVMMKACQYDKRFLRSKVQPHVFAIVESNHVDPDVVDYFCNGDAKLKEAMDTIISELHNAKEYGSIITVSQQDWEALYARFDEIQNKSVISTYTDEALKLRSIVNVAKAMAQKYHVVITNPPYMGASGMSAKLSDYVKKNYPDSKSDLFAVFIDRGNQMVVCNGINCMVTMQSWMFLSSFEKLREKCLRNKTIINLMHMENMVMGIAFGTAVTAFRNNHIPQYKGTYNYIKHKDIVDDVPKEFPIKVNRFAQVTTDNFSKIPGSPVAYWVSKRIVGTFGKEVLGDILTTREGMATADNDSFLRLWSEVSIDNIGFGCTDTLDAKEIGCTWFPYNKGGDYRKWYGNNDYVVNWENDGQLIRNNKDVKTGRIRSHNYNGGFAFRKGVTWSALSSSNISVRYADSGFLFDSKGAKGFAASEDELYYAMALINSKAGLNYLSFISPTIDFKVGDIIQIPLIRERIEDIIERSKRCVQISKIDWDSFETSWDFQRHPLLRNVSTIAEAFNQWHAECDNRFNQLKANEEELNRIFIDIYGLQDELTPEVADKDITVYRIFDSKEDVPESMKGSRYIRTKEDEVVSFISYAVGCMFGRYSLDVDGLAYAGGNYDSKYCRWIRQLGNKATEEIDENGKLIHGGWAGCTLWEYDGVRKDGKWIPASFAPDTDNIIPICDDDYFDDDIVGRFVEFVKTVYGADTLEENLKFIADALGGKGQPKDVIRNYFLSDFYSDHCKIYQKRPIYWLFDSGTKNGFKALIYMHRYTPDTIGNLRVDYLHKMQRIYDSEINRMQDTIDHSTNPREVAAATKRKEKLQKQLKECREYDEKIGHLALSRIELDLDDGVKNNYRKVQTASDGKFYEVLADSKNIMAKEK